MARVPDELMAQFRVEAMEKIERIDASWTALVNHTATDHDEAMLLRDVHTLKGDARVVGMSEIATLAQHLEDLLAAARARAYRVHEDVDVVVTMAIQFIAMLVRKHVRVRQSLDLDGFLKQIEDVTADWLQRSTIASVPPFGHHLRVKENTIPNSTARLQLASATTGVFFEYIRADGDSKKRYYDAWLSLLDNVNAVNSVALGPMIDAHVSTARELADRLGKNVSIEVKGGHFAVGPETASVVATALLHALTNAVDHGIEASQDRMIAGKSARGSIAVEITRDKGDLSICVADDGFGVDFERVRRRALERGLLSPHEATLASEQTLLDCLLAAGFSTRDVASDISGRGIGLDAVCAAVRGHGGSLAISAESGRGSRVTLQIPDARGVVAVTAFDTSMDGLTLAVPSNFIVKPTTRMPSSTFEDAFQLPVGRAACALEISGDGVDAVVRAGSLPRVARAVRICPTPESDIAEVVRIDQLEVVLLRPRNLYA